MWGGIARFKVVKIATDPRFIAVTVRGWNTMTSLLGKTARTGNRYHTHKMGFRTPTLPIIKKDTKSKPIIKEDSTKEE